MSDDFIKDMVDFLRSQRQQEKRDAAKSAIEEKAKAARCPAFWEEIRHKVKATCDEIAKEMQEQLFSFPQDQPTSDGFTVNYLGKQTLTVRYEPKTRQISYHTLNMGSGTFTPIVEAGEVIYSDGSEPVSSVQAAQRMVAVLTGRRR